MQKVVKRESPAAISASARIHSLSDSAVEQLAGLNKFASNYNGRRHKCMALQFAVSETVLMARNFEDVRIPAFHQTEIAEPIPQLVVGVEPQIAGVAFAAASVVAASRVLVAGRIPVVAGEAVT
jgi:hypothetical protein